MYIYLANIANINDAMSFAQRIKSITKRNVNTYIHTNSGVIKYALADNPFLRVQDLFQLQFAYWDKYHLLGLYSDDLWIARQSEYKEIFDAVIWVDREEIMVNADIPLINMHVPAETRQLKDFKSQKDMVGIIKPLLDFDHIDSNPEILTFMLNAIDTYEAMVDLQNACNDTKIIEKVYPKYCYVVYTENMEDEHEHITQIIGVAGSIERARDFRDAAGVYLENHNNQSDDVFIKKVSMDDFIDRTISVEWNDYNLQVLDPDLYKEEMAEADRSLA